MLELRLSEDRGHVDHGALRITDEQRLTLDAGRQAEVLLFDPD